MAITSIGSLVAASDKNSAVADFTLTPSRNVAAGRFLVAFISWDSVFSIFNPNDGEVNTWIDDSAGNHWCNIGACVDRSTFFNGGCSVVIAVTQLRSALTTSSTITAHGLSAFIGTIIAKAVSIEEFDLGTGMRWAMQRGAWPKNEVRGGDPGAISIDAEVTREWLFLHALGNEAPPTDTFTWDSDYTRITAAGTTGGASDSNVTIEGGWRIATLSTDGVDIVNTTAARDVVQTMAAITAVPSKAFPQNGIIDNFNRANEFPVNGGVWDTVGGKAFGSAYGTLTSNQATGGGGSRLLATDNDCVEVYATNSVVSTASDDWANLHVHMGGDSSTATMFGACSAAWYVQVLGNTFDVIWFAPSSGNQGDPFSSHCVAFIAAVNGNKWGIQRARTGLYFVNHLFVDVGSGWQEVAAIFDSSGVITSGHIAFGIKNGNTKIDDFGGGEFPCGKVFRPQIYRRAYGDR